MMLIMHLAITEELFKCASVTKLCISAIAHIVGWVEA